MLYTIADYIYLIIFLFLIIANLAFSFFIVFLERKSPQSTYAWLLILWAIPAVGFILYVLLSQNLARRKIYKYNYSDQRIYNTLLENQKSDLICDKNLCKNPVAAEYKSLIKFHQTLSYSLYTEDNTIEIYTDGEIKFPALFEAINNAQNHINIQYFIVKNDDLGRELINLLAKKAEEGIKVKLLIDAFGSNSLNDFVLSPLRNAGGEVGIFFPSKIKFINLKANYRNHRKICVIDGDIGFVGGFNVGNEYINRKETIGFWRDTHLKITGSAVYELQLQFMMDWKVGMQDNPESVDVSESSRYYPEIHGTGNVGIQIVSSGPDDINQQVKQGYLKMIMEAEKYIYIQTPYFVLDEAMMEAFRIAVNSGIEVRIMIPNQPDHMFVYWATYSNVGDLIKYGAKVYIYDNGFLHAKVALADDKIASVGSCNFDIRSFALNFETNAFIYDQNTTLKLKKIYENDMEKSILLTKELYSQRSTVIKFKESISRLLSPLL
jgi:cardiolipin synthase